MTGRGPVYAHAACHRGNPSDYDKAVTNENTDYVIKTMTGSVEEIKLVTGNLPELESRPGAAGYSCRFAFLKNYSNTDTAYAIEGLDGDGRLETNVPGSFEYDVSSNNPPVGNDEDGYFYPSDASRARARYEDTGQNAFRIDCEDVDGRYQRLCESVVRS